MKKKKQKAATENQIAEYAKKHGYNLNNTDNYIYCAMRVYFLNNK